MTSARLADWLSGLGAEALAELLDRRRDVVLGRAPSTLGGLAERLAHPESVAAALRGLPLPCLQVLEAGQALGEGAGRRPLIDLLAGHPGPEHERSVDAVLAELTALGLLWPGDGDRLEVPAGLAAVFPKPLGLGPPARQVWADVYAEAIARAVRALGGRPHGRKAENLEALLAVLADPERVREYVAQAPPAVAQELQRLAWQGPDEEDDDYLIGRFDPEAYRRQREAEQWGQAHGLLAHSSWSYTTTMPAEVALALRGANYRAPFSPQPPAVPTHEIALERVESAAAAAITSFATHALALLDRIARTPVPLLAGGGVGVRELGRLIKELGMEDAEVRLVLALAAAGGLLLPNSAGLGVSDRFEDWRAAEPAAQAASLLAAWWSFPTVPTRSRDADGKALPVLRGSAPCAGCQAGRVVLLQAAAALPPGTAADPADLARAARWQRPLVHVLPEDAQTPLATVWREAGLLGAVAAGALSPVGAALLAGDLDTAHDHLRRLLPEASDSAMFGSDLTALVSGTPSAAVTAALDGCADRESSGGAITWRFSPSSVRRALDAGTDAEALVEQLSALSVRELPQPLAYLIRDVARRHGRLRLLPAVSLIRSDDAALLAEVAADRRLGSLGLQQVAPTVLSCAMPLEAALARLREVGYFPVPDASVPTTMPAARSRGGDRSPGRVRPRSTARRAEHEALAAADVARRLLADKDTTVPTVDTETAAELARSVRHLSGAEIGWLADAVDEGGRVRIEYQAASGAVTRRVISDPELVGGMLHAWCELRQDERVFAASRILSVHRPADQVPDPEALSRATPRKDAVSPARPGPGSGARSR